MRFKVSLLAILSSVLVSSSSYALGDILIQGGFSDLKCRECNTSTDATGLNAGAAYLTPMFGVPFVVDFVVGPTLKYESVKDSNVNLKNTPLIRKEESFKTLQAGLEAGVKVKLIPLVTLYATGFGSYGFQNSLSEKFEGDGLNILNHTVEPGVSGSWQMGGNVRLLFNIVPMFFGVGLGASFFQGQYDYENTNLATVAGSNMALQGGTTKYSGRNFNIAAALYL